MPIEMSCHVCGRELYLRDQLAGRQIRCPDCQATLAVPLARLPTVEPAPLAAPPTEKYDALLDRSQDRALPTVEAVPAEEKPAPRPGRTAQANGSNADGPSAGVVGGLAMMVGGGVWAYVSWQHKNFAPHGLILFVVGLIAFVRGIAGAATRNRSGT